MTRRIEIRIPKLPVFQAPAVEPAAPTGAGTFGPLGWQYASQGDNGDTPMIFDPMLALLRVRAYDTAAATCPGAVSWRVEPPIYRDFPLTGALILWSNDSVSAFNVYAIDAAGQELGPIVLQSVP